MKFNKDHLADIRRSALLSVAVGALLATPSFAQDAQDAQDAQEDEATSEDEEDKIVVTGSRVRRDTFTSTSPLQVIDAETIREAGLVDTAEILKSTPVVQGAQLDVNVSSNFPTGAGPGAANVSLRGLNASQTLVLINGRRLAPSGVEGAPSNPDLNLIPSSMVQRVDVLLDGASSIYGSDAVAGVVNVITRTDYEGFNLDAFYSVPEDTGGGSERYSMIMGDVGERGGFTFAAEYLKNDELIQKDRDYTYAEGRSCSFDYEIGGTPEKRCHGAIGNAILDIFGSGWVYPNAGAASDIGVPGWRTIGADFTAGTRDAQFRDDYISAEDQMLPGQQRMSFFFAGDYDLDNVLQGTEAFFEASYSNSQTTIRSTPGQHFPTVDPANPFNPGFFLPVVPVMFLPHHRGAADVEVQQARMLAGLRGDLGFAGLTDWDYELNVGYTRSQGFSSRNILLEDRLNLSLGTARIDPGSGNIICGINPGDNTFGQGDIFGFLSVAQCVPVNLFAPSLYTPGINDFATQAESDFLRGTRNVTTFIDQKIISGFVTGPLFELPAGEIKGVFGLEARQDGLDSNNDTVAATGGAAGFFADKNSKGEVGLFELFGELDIPIVRDASFAKDITVNLSGRYIDHEFYGQDSVYAAKANWTPTDFLTFRGTYGTSFRAPNLRELFLGGQSGFASGFTDPCVVPLAANNGGVYNPAGETRSAQTLANCVSEGVDPTALGLGGVGGIESNRAGNLQLQPETSDAYTIGAVLQQPWTDAFDLRVGVNYFSIEVNNSVAVPSTGFILGTCYNSSNFPNDPFCQRRVRDPLTGFLTSVDRTPFNIASQASSGWDFNVAFALDKTIMNRDWTFDLDSAITLTDNVDQIITTTSTTTNVFTGDFGTPEWRATTNLRASTGPWTIFWRTRYIGEQTNLGVFGAIVPNIENGGTPVNSVDEYFNHDLSLSWSQDTWALRFGVNNLFNETPPLIDQDVSDATLTNHNVPLGTGYDLIGRRFFFNASKSF